MMQISILCLKRMPMPILETIKRLLCLNDEIEEVKNPLSKEIFREYDIRGIVGKTLFPENAFSIGRAFGTYLRRNNMKLMCVGHDCRNSSDELSYQLIKGLTYSGAEVVELGVCHTPMMYYTVNKMRMDAGIMVTGSHNTGDYNGFKFMLGSDPFYGEDIKLLGKMVWNNDFIEANGREIILNDIFSNYISDILKDFSFAKDLKVAWDIGNGATSNAIREIVSRIPGRHHVLFEEMDGNFPNRQPDPTIENNVSYLCKFVSYNKFDIGFAFDSDGDRLGVINSKGKLLFSDQLLEIFAKDFLRKNPGGQVIADVKTRNKVFDTIRMMGGSPIMERVGHSFIKARMKSSGALLAGEMSGHFFFKDRWFGFDDGIYAALRCLEILSQDKEAFNNTEYGFVTPEIRIQCPNETKFEIIKDIRKRLKNKNTDLVNTDGVRVSNDHGWWLLRASNTREAISLRVEAYQQEFLPKMLDEIGSYLKKYISDIKNILAQYG